MKKKILMVAVVSLVFALCVGTALALEPVRVFVNDNEVIGDTPAQIVNGRTMVPLRFVAEALDAKVDYDPVHRKAIITTAKNKQEPTWNLMKVNGELTTWPYWEQDGILYMEYRNCIDLLEMKYQTPWHKVDYNSIKKAIIVDQRVVTVYEKTIGDFTCVSLQDLKRQEIFDYEWDSDKHNLTFK